MNDVSEHSLHSSYREMLLEHLFAGEVMRHMWLAGCNRLEILKPQVDDGGYDLVLEANSYVRHVQLKPSVAQPLSGLMSMRPWLTSQAAAWSY